MTPVDGALAEFYMTILPQHIGEKGFPMLPLLTLDHQGKLTYAVLPGLDLQQTLSFAMSQIANLNTKEMVCAADRYLIPGQQPEKGKYNDVLTLYWWYGPHTNNGWRFGIVNYKPAPESLIEPIVWNNAFWNDVMAQEIDRIDDEARAAVRRLAIKAGPEAIAERLRNKGVAQEIIDRVLARLGIGTLH